MAHGWWCSSAAGTWSLWSSPMTSRVRCLRTSQNKSERLFAGPHGGADGALRRGRGEARDLRRGRGRKPNGGCEVARKSPEIQIVAMVDVACLTFGSPMHE